MTGRHDAVISLILGFWLMILTPAWADDALPLEAAAEDSLSDRIQNALMERNWKAGTALCREWYTINKNTRAQSELYSTCLELAFSSGNLPLAAEWLEPCQAEPLDAAVRAGQRYLENYGFDLLQLTAELSIIRPGARDCVLQTIGHGLVKAEKCHDAFLVARELYGSIRDWSAGLPLWEAARICQSAADGDALSNVALFVPLSSGSNSGSLASIFRGFQLASMESGETRPRVLDSSQLEAGREADLLSALWTGKVGGLLAIADDQEALERLREVHRGLKIPIGILPIESHLNEGGETESVADGLIDLRHGKRALRNSMLTFGSEQLGIRRFFWVSQDHSLQTSIEGDVSLPDSTHDFHIVEEGVRGDKSSLRKMYRRWSATCASDEQGCGIVFDLPSKDAAHILPYLELEGMKFCSAPQVEDRCVRVLGRDDWNRGNGGDATGRKLDGSLFVVEFDSTNSLPAVQEFVKAFEERFSRVPGTSEAIVYTLFRAIGQWLMTAGTIEADSSPGWKMSEQGERLFPSVLGNLKLVSAPTGSYELSREFQFNMTMREDRPITWEQSNEEGLPEILDEIGGSHEER